MTEFRPVGHIIGWMTVVLGLSMMLPAVLDFADRSDNWRGFALAAFLTFAAGAALILITFRSGRRTGLGRKQAFLLTVLVWAVLPFFGALPFVLAEPAVSYTDAYFEAMSGLTTTGATVFSGLDEAPRGMLLWRAMMQWYGGVGIVVFAIVFLPTMKIGGMQFFRSEGFETTMDVLPRATEAALELMWFYLGLSAACMLAYSATGMNAFDALCHAMTTVSTGGMGNYDTSFSTFPPSAQYVAVLFMVLGAIPFLRLVQMGRGRPRALIEDSQVRAFLAILLTVAAVVALWLALNGHHPPIRAVREALFNITAIMTGTGYASDNFNTWGGPVLGLFLMVAMIGGCTGSTACSAKVFRYQILLAALRVQIRRIHSPHGVYPLRYNGRPVDAEVVSSIMSFLFVFIASIVCCAILLSLLGLDLITAISGSVATLCNVGPGLGPVIGPTGNYAPLPDEAKWVMSVGMLLGRLEFLSVLVLFTPMFWNR